MPASRLWTAKRVAALRESLGMDQGELAARVGVTRGTVSHWETGIRKPSGSAAILLDFLQNEANRLVSQKI